MTKSLQEMLVGLALVATAIVALISINAGSETAFESGLDASMTSKTFPTVMAVGLGVLSVIFTAGALFRLHAEWRQANAEPSRSVLLGPSTLITLAVVALLLAYAYLIKTINFGLLTFIFLFLGFFLFGQRNYVLIAIVAAIGSAVFYGLFVLVLELPLNP